MLTKLALFYLYFNHVIERLPVFQIISLDQERLWLGLPLPMVPQDTLASKRTMLRALHGLFNINIMKGELPAQAGRPQLELRGGGGL